MTRLRLRFLAEQTARIDALDREERAVARELTALVKLSGSTLTELRGIAARSAAELLVEVGDPRRFTEGGFARFNGSAPLPCSSGEGAGEPVRHRFNPHGNRRVNCVLHHMALTQLRCDHGRDNSTTTHANEATRSQKPCASSSADSPTSSTAK